MRSNYMRSCVLVGVAVALLSAPALAAVGDLEYVKGPLVGQGVSIRFATPRKLAGGGRTGLPKGNLVVASGTMGGAPVSAALTGAKDFDALRLDLTGKGNFRNAATVPVRTTRKSANMYMASIGPAQISFKKNRKTIPVTVSGQYYENEGIPRLYVILTAAVEGSCAFGKTIRKVRITDASGNLRFDDAATGRNATGRYDLVQLADENGQFGASSSAPSTVLGHPIQIGGTWYTMRVRGMKVSAARSTCSMGKITGKGEKWQLMLRGRKYTITVAGGSEPVKTPADTYQVMRCNYFHTGSAGKTPAMVGSYPHLSVKVRPGRTLAIPMGLPIKATISATVKNRKVAFSVKRTDAAGNRIVSVVNAAGRRPKAPAIDVIDKTGKVVYTAQLEYG